MTDAGRWALQGRDNIARYDDRLLDCEYDEARAAGRGPRVLPRMRRAAPTRHAHVRPVREATGECDRAPIVLREHVRSARQAGAPARRGCAAWCCRGQRLACRTVLPAGCAGPEAATSPPAPHGVPPASSTG